MLRLSLVPKLTSRQAYTMGIAELRRSVEQPGGEAVRTVPLLERNDRQRQQANRLSGVETEAKAFEQTYVLTNPLSETSPYMQGL